MPLSDPEGYSVLFSVKSGTRGKQGNMDWLLVKQTTLY